MPIEEQDPGSSEPVGEVAEAIWEPSCDTTPEDFYDDLWLSHVTDTSYGHAGCHKTWIAEVKRLGESGIIVRDIGPVPTTKAACESLWMSVQVVEGQRLCPPAPRSCWHEITADQDPKYTKRGRWSGTRCELPEFYLSEYWGEFPSPSVYPYRVYATARSSRDGATRRILFESPVI